LSIENKNDCGGEERGEAICKDKKGLGGPKEYMIWVLGMGYDSPL
jgi:hypothetical protein